MANSFTIGQSALNAAQAAINTAGQNIANSSAPGYSRQTVVQTAAMPAAGSSYGYSGQGTQITQIQRVYSQFLADQTHTNEAANSQLQTQYQQIQQLDNLLADPNAGISAAMQSFFDDLQTVSIDPNDVNSREILLMSAKNLVSRFNSFQTKLDEISQNLNQQMASGVQTVNDLAKQVAGLNKAINTAQASSNGKPANDLLDKRDQLITELSRQVKVSVLQQDQQYTVLLNNGQPLVAGDQVYGLKLMSSTTDATDWQVGYPASAQQASVLSANDLMGGSLSGLLAFRAETLNPFKNSLVKIALGFAETVNQSNQAGYTINGQTGSALFTIPEVKIKAAATNSGGATVNASLIDSGQLTNSDYKLQKIADEYRFIRAADNNLLISSADFAEVQSIAANQGLAINLAADMNNGDQFLIQPTFDAAGTLKLANIQANDFAVSNRPYTANNANTLLMAGLQSQKTLDGGTNSFQDAYTQLVSQIAGKTHELEVTSSFHANMLAESQTAVDSVSGVNLDEEAANLLRYQQAYQSAGKLIQISQQLFESLLQIN